jgi:F0F1-type ATP synthase membrane subunit b/b'
MHTKQTLLLQLLKSKPKQGMPDSGMGAKRAKTVEGSGGLSGTAKSADEALGKLINSTERLRSKFSGLEGILSNVQTNISTITGGFNELSTGIGVTAAAIGNYSTQLLKAVKSATSYEQMNSELNKTFGITSQKASDIAQQLRGFSKVLDIGDDKLFKYAGSLKGITGGFIASSKVTTSFKNDLMSTQTYLQNNLQLEEESAQKFELYARGMGKSGTAAAEQLNHFSKMLSDTTGLDATQIQKDIITDIAALGEDLQMQYGRVPGQLETATMKARILGTSLEQLNSTGKGMLDIQSSVSSEMNYQQLTGHRLLDSQGKSLTNEYRKATLQGNANKQMDLMMDFLDAEGDMLDTNMLAREEAAKLFNMSEAELMKQKQMLKLAKETGSLDLIKKAKGDMTKLQKELEQKGKYTPEKIAEIIKSADTRTTAEKSEDHLKAIRAQTVRGIAATKDSFGNTLANNVKAIGQQMFTAVSKSMESYQATLSKDASGKYDNTVTRLLGQFKTFGETFDVVKVPLSQFSSILPGVNDTFKNFINTFASYLPELPEDPVEKAAGGYISGPGTSTSDSIPARLSDGEYVINAAATSRFRPILDQINSNSGPINLKAGGGPVMSTSKMETLLAGILQQIQKQDLMYGTKRI